jgi:hypothetical protein
LPEQPEKQPEGSSDMEKNLMGMFGNLAKQLENLDDDDDAEIDDASIAEAEKMMQGLFGNMMGGGAGGAGGQGGAGGMDSMMAELFKGMGMGMPPGNNK